jgi:hypothetical protein
MRRRRWIQPFEHGWSHPHTREPLPELTGMPARQHLHRTAIADHEADTICHDVISTGSKRVRW